jgi:hypothetical protein
VNARRGRPRSARNARVQFTIPESRDCLYRIYNHRYLLTHCDQKARS